MTEAAYWKTLGEIGWLDWLPKDQWADVRSTLKKNLEARRKEAWLALAQGGFECGSNSPTALIMRLAKISRGVFSPKKVRLQQRTLSLEYGRKTYQCALTPPFEFDVIDLVNQCLGDTDAEPRFFVLPGGDTFACLVFVPPDVYEMAIRGRLIQSQVKSDLVVAPLSESPEIARTPKLTKRWPSCWTDPVGPADFTELCRLIGDTHPRPLRECLRLASQATAIYGVEEKSAVRLANLSDKKLAAIAKRWSKSPGLREHVETESEMYWLTDKLFEIRDIAAQATSEARLLLRYRTQ